MAANSTNITPGMTISINDKLYRVETAVKVTVPKGTPFIKTKLRDLHTNEVVEKNFKPNQSVKEVSLLERNLEYLYEEGGDYLFLDIDNLDQIHVTPTIIGNKIHYLKEGTDVKAQFYGDVIYSLELPQFLEIMVSKTEDLPENKMMANATKKAVLETGAVLQVPLFIDVGDIVKVDTRNDEYIQRV